MKIQISGDSELFPKFAHSDDAGCDIMAAHDGTINPQERQLVKTGINISLPEGYAAFVHPRSGLALKQGITVLNTPGTIDSGYRGEVGVVLYNSGNEAFIYKRGDRIAQLVFQKIEQPSFEIVESLNDSIRGEKGFGSTGV
jgi:dUTP pyrophosphatase